MVEMKNITELFRRCPNRERCMAKVEPAWKLYNYYSHCCLKDSKICYAMNPRDEERIQMLFDFMYEVGA